MKQIIYKWQNAFLNMNLDSAVENFRLSPRCPTFCPTLTVFTINPMF